MAIIATCPRCRASFKAKDEHAGRRGTCPRCQAVIEVPHGTDGRGRQTTDPPSPPAVGADGGAPPDGPPEGKASPSPARAAAADAASPRPTPPSTTSPTPASTVTPTPQQILGAFQGAIEPVELSAAYHASLLLVLVVMVLLPLIYIALIGLVCWAAYLHAVHDVTVFAVVQGGRSAMVAALFYLGPLVAGAICVVFMIKPLFAAPAEEGRTRSLTPKSDPLLFAFVARVCEAVGAPEPKQIRVDCEVNASAGFRRGIRSMLLSDDLVLIIGLPLVAGLDLRQFAGVLAHEFGHFTQGTAMRLSYLIRAINIWFFRVVYHRDQWDVWLETAANNSYYLIAAVLHFARLCVWLSRWILWGLMVVGHIVSGFLVRQMELDADRHQARLVGTEVFRSTRRSLALLSYAYERARSDLGEFYREGRLGDNLPRLIMANLEQIPAKVVETIGTHEREATTGLFDTHPADKDRIANAERENSPGVFHVKCPATMLFSNFEALSKNVTWDFYRAIFGPRFQPAEMHPVEELLVRREAQWEADATLSRFFQGEFPWLRPLPLPADLLSAPANAREVADQLREARQRMLEAGAVYANASKVFVEADREALEAGMADALLVIGMKSRKGEFKMPLRNRPAVRDALATARARQRDVAGQMENYERAAGIRLLAALKLLGAPQVAARVENARKLQEQSAGLLGVLSLLNRQHHSLLELRKTYAVLSILGSRLRGNEQNSSLISAIGKQTEALHDLVRGLCEALSNQRYPFDHADGRISIGESIVYSVPPKDDVVNTHAAGGAFIEQLPALYLRVLGQLAVSAEKVETAIGLPPLPDPASGNGESHQDG